MAEQANMASATETVAEQQGDRAGTAGNPPAAQAEGEQPAEGAAAAPAPVLTLRLRPRPSVTWSADVINNEGMGKKSSKRECAARGWAGHETNTHVPT